MGQIEVNGQYLAIAYVQYGKAVAAATLGSPYSTLSPILRLDLMSLAVDCNCMFHCW